MGFPRWLNPLPIEISSEEVTPVISVDYSIDVEHRDDPEDEVIPELPGNRVVTQKKVDDILNEVADHSLARMHSCCQKNHLFVFDI
jgi:hypothetical protein